MVSLPAVPEYSGKRGGKKQEIIQGDDYKTILDPFY
jgi:hypothetical protein